MSISAYLKHLKYERNLSELTLKTYQRSLETIEKTNALELHKQNSAQLQSALLTLRRAGAQSATLNRYRAALHGYYQWLKKENKIEDDPSTSLKIPKKEKKILPKTLSPEQIERLLQAPKDDDIKKWRNCAIFELFYSTGMRLAELAQLNIEQLQHLPEEITIQGKGNKMRRIFIGEKARKTLAKWLSLRPKTQNNALFTNQRGTRLSPRGIQLLLEKHANERLDGIHVNPHMLRHSFASHILQSSNDIRAVQELLGHQNLSTTEHYTHLDFQHLAKIYDQSHPRAKKPKDES